MPSPIYAKIKSDISPLSDHVLVVNMEKGDTTTKAGIIILDDNGKDRGIRPRWCQVYKVGSNIDYLEPGQWILVEHGRWTFGIEMVLPDTGDENEFYIQRVDVSGILGVSDDCPLD